MSLRWKMQGPCSVVLLWSAFKVVLGFWCGGFWVLLVSACLLVAASALCGPSLRPRKPSALLTRVFVYSHVPCMGHVFVCVPRLELHPRWQRGPCLVLAPGFFVLGSWLVLGSGLAVPACAPVCCKCLAFVPSPLDPLLLQVHRLPRWRMPRPCSVLLLCSGFRVVLGFWCGGFWFLLLASVCPLASGCQSASAL